MNIPSASALFKFLSPHLCHAGYGAVLWWRLMVEWLEAEVTESLSLRISASSRGLCAIHFGPAAPPQPPSSPPSNPSPQNPLLIEALSQLQAYFSGRLREFHLPLDMAGTEFQLGVWRQLQTIPYGTTCSYSAIAQAIGRPAAVRAVGAANGANPLPIVVPCHRVIGASGSLVGYGGGLPLKKRLLALERMDEILPALRG
jgi:methylated-DNA-[protein]-cysteine S-methyltransferase